MINSLKKKVLLVVLAFVSFFMAFSGVCGIVTAKADGNVLDSVEFTMIDGAQIRLDGNNGMRFAGKLDSEDASVYETLEYGIFIMPEYYVNQFGAIEYSTTFGAESVYDWDESIDQGKHKIIHMESLAVQDPELDNAWVVRGTVLMGAYAKNLATTYVARAYVKNPNAEGESAYKFADVSAYTGRSMLDVAVKAKYLPKYEDELSEGRQAIDAYIAQYVDYNNDVAPEYNCTVNYKVNGYDGIVDSEVVSVPMDTVIDGYLKYSNIASSAQGKRVYASNATFEVELDSELVQLNGQLYKGEVAYLGVWAAHEGETQTFELPEEINGASNIKIAGYLMNATIEGNTFTIPTADLEGFSQHGGVKDLTFFDSNNNFYVAKLTVADLVVRDASKAYYLQETNNNNYIVIATNIDANSEPVNPRIVSGFSGTIDGKGNVIRNYKITGWSGMIATGIDGEGVKQVFSGTIKNIAFVNIDNGGKDGSGYDGIFSEIASGATIENVYIHGLSTREQLFATIGDNGVTIRDVILNFNDGYDYEGQVCCFNTKIGGDTIFEESTGEITYEGEFMQIWNVEATLWNKEVGTTFGDFELKADGLYFNGNLIKAR